MQKIIDLRGNPAAMAVSELGEDIKIEAPTLDRMLITKAHGTQIYDGLSSLVSRPPVTDTLLANGDSITYGIREPGIVTLAQTFVQKVGTARGFANIVNTAVPGNTTSQMLSHWAADLATHKPDAAFIMMSANNYRLGVSIAQSKQDMLDMINMAQNAGANVTIATHNIYVDSDYLNNFAPQERAMMQELAGLPGVQFCDVFTEWMVRLYYNGSVSSSDPYFKSLYAPDGNGNPDWIHPSALGHQIIADFMLLNPLVCARTA